MKFRVLADFDRVIAQEFQALGSPSFFILDREGKVLFRQSGIRSPKRLKRVLKKEVDKALNQ